MDLTVLGWENGFIIDGFLDVCHDVVDVLRGSQPRLFAFLVDPTVLPAQNKSENEIALPLD